MSIAVLITIISSIIGVLLAINAFFIKSLVNSINKLQMQMTTVTIQHDHTVNDVKDNKARIFELEKENAKQRERLHSLEGGQSQIMTYIKDDNK